MVRVAWPRGQNEDFEAVDPHRGFADVAFLVPLADEMGKKHTTQAPTSQQATSNQDACKPVIFTAAAFPFFTTYVLVLFLVPLAEEMGKKQTAQSPTAQQATSNQLTDDLLLVTTALPFATQTSSFSFRLVQ